MGNCTYAVITPPAPNDLHTKLDQQSIVKIKFY